MNMSFEVDREAIANASRAIWVLLAAMLVAVVHGFRSRGLEYDLGSGLSLYLIVAACVVVALVYRHWRPDPRISFGCEATAQLLILALLGMLLTYPLASLGFAYRDAELHAIDNWIGLDWLTCLDFINDHPILGLAGKVAYRSMAPQYLVVILLLVATSRFVRVQQYLLAVALSLLVTLSIFTFAPAVATYAHLRVPEAAYANLTPSVLYEHVRHLEAMRMGTPFVIRVDNIEGLIGFPSYHTVCAVIFIWALFPIAFLRWGALALNLAMIASTPIEGAHYFIDIFGGILVAVAAIWCAGVLLPRLSSTRLFAFGAKARAQLQRQEMADVTPDA
jgi:membrane-associated phospholipid phosphatase